jgi:hypothetical protein
MKRQPFALPYAGIHKEADLGANHAAAAPVEPAVGDYISDALGGLGVPREQALALGSAFGLVPQWSRDSGRAMALPFFEPTAGNVAGAGVEAALMGLPAAKVAKRALPMDEAARMARAAEQGFNPTTLYHGTPNADIEAFDAARAGSRGGSDSGTWLTASPKSAGTYAENAAGNYPEGAGVLPVRTRTENMDVWDMGGASYSHVEDDINRAIAEAKEAGRDGVVFKRLIDSARSVAAGGEASRNAPTVVNVFDPANIRSVNAAFDPAQVGSPNLLASVAALFGLPMAASYINKGDE